MGLSSPKYHWHVSRGWSSYLNIFVKEVSQGRKLVGRVFKATFNYTSIMKKIVLAYAAGIIARLHNYTLD